MATTQVDQAKLHVPAMVDVNDSSNSSALDVEKLPEASAVPVRTVHGWKVSASTNHLNK
jgi:hypothetical protein